MTKRTTKTNIEKLRDSLLESEKDWYEITINNCKAMGIEMHSKESKSLPTYQTWSQVVNQIHLLDYLLGNNDDYDMFVGE